MKAAAIFQSGLVFQRGKPVLIWGTGTPGERIQGTIQGRSAETAADADGTWTLRIPALRESICETLTLEGNCHVKIDDVAVGEVFVAAGQSNMEFWMRYEKHYPEILPVCENPNIRFFDLPKRYYPGQEYDFDYRNAGIWRKASQQDLQYFSAVGYYLARKLEKDLSIPVGIIGCSWGGTRSQAWMTADHARSIQKIGKRAWDPWNPMNEFLLPGTPSADEIQAFLRENSVEPSKPENTPGALYRNMVQSLAPYTVRAVLWYQGESDDETDGAQKNYRAALDAIKEDWRCAWEESDLPFFVVQLPGFSSWFGLVNKGYPIIRVCQQESVDADSHAYLCSVSDAGEEFDIHPKNKMVVGERLALLAEKHLFGMDILADAPRPGDVRWDGNTITVFFEYAEGGLLVDGEEINALSVVQEKREIAYTAEICGSSLVIRIPPAVSGELTVKFACEAWYRVNLYNQAHIPAVPFAAKVQRKEK